jgi:hypothetical protein
MRVQADERARHWSIKRERRGNGERRSKIRVGVQRNEKSRHSRVRGKAEKRIGQMPGTGARSTAATVGMARETWQMETAKRTTWIKLTLTQQLASTRDQRQRAEESGHFLWQRQRVDRIFWGRNSPFLHFKKRVGRLKGTPLFKKPKPTEDPAHHSSSNPSCHHHVVHPSGSFDLLCLVAAQRVLFPVGTSRSVATILFGPHAPAERLASGSTPPSAFCGLRFHPPECSASATGGHHTASQPSPTSISSRGFVHPCAAESVAVRFESI